MHSSLLGPVVALVAWTTLFRIWMAVKHTAAAKRSIAGVADDAAAPPVEQNPYTSAFWEQPTRFYAIVFALIFMGMDGPMNVWIAWAYVGLRVIHSIIQATFNEPRTRFYLFLAGTICLVALITHAAIFLMHHG